MIAGASAYSEGNDSSSQDRRQDQNDDGSVVFGDFSHENSVADRGASEHHERVVAHNGVDSYSAATAAEELPITFGDLDIN